MGSVTVKLKINGIDGDLGDYNSGSGFTLGRFEESPLKLRRDGQTDLMVDRKKVITDAMNYIAAHCAQSKGCNAYFLKLNKRSPISLAGIIDQKTIQIFRLVPWDDKTEKDLPAGFTLAWGAAYAQIGINEPMLTDSMSAASVLLHELAHVAGAPGRREDPKSLAAETALLNCGMKKYFDEKALGSIEVLGSGRTRLA